MDTLWGAIDMGHWQQTPCLTGRLASERDVEEGHAVFFLGHPDEYGAAHADMALPHCAFLSTEEESQPVIVIQSEQEGDEHYLGYRLLKGGNGVCLRHEVELLTAPDERFC